MDQFRVDTTEVRSGAAEVRAVGVRFGEIGRTAETALQAAVAAIDDKALRSAIVVNRDHSRQVHTNLARSVQLFADAVVAAASVVEENERDLAVKAQVADR